MQGKCKANRKEKKSNPHELLSGGIKLTNNVNMPKRNKHESNEEPQDGLHFRKLRLGRNRCVINNLGQIVGLSKSKMLAGAVSMDQNRTNRDNSKRLKQQKLDFKHKQQKLDFKHKQSQLGSPRCSDNVSIRISNVSLRKAYKSKDHSEKKVGTVKIGAGRIGAGRIGAGRIKEEKIDGEKIKYEEHLQKIQREYEAIANRESIACRDENYSRIYDIDSAREDRSMDQLVVQDISVAELTEQIKVDIQECLLRHRYSKPILDRGERIKCISMLSRICEVIKTHKSTYALSVELMEGGCGEMHIVGLSSLIIALKIDDSEGMDNFCDQFLMSTKQMRRSKRSMRVDEKALHSIQNTRIENRDAHKINKIQSESNFKATLISLPQASILNKSTSVDNLVEELSADVTVETGSKILQEASTAALITNGNISLSFKHAILNKPDLPRNSMFRPHIVSYYQADCKDTISLDHVLNEELNVLFAHSFRVALKTTVYYLDSLSLLWDRYLSQLSQECSYCLLFRSKDTLNHSSTFQLLEMHNLKSPNPSIHPKYIRVLSAMYLMVRVRLESGEQFKEQELGVRAGRVREAFARSPNALFCGGANAIFGSYLELLGLSLADLMQCIQDQAQCLSRAVMMRHQQKSKHVHNIALMGLNQH